MIIGIHCDVTSDELKKHLLKKHTYHDEKAKQYGKQADDLVKMSEETEGGRGKFSNDPVESLSRSTQSHRKQADFYLFVHDHVVPNEVYRLSDGDLMKLGFTSQGY